MEGLWTKASALNVKRTVRCTSSYHSRITWPRCQARTAPDTWCYKTSAQKLASKQDTIIFFHRNSYFVCKISQPAKAVWRIHLNLYKFIPESSVYGDGHCTKIKPYLYLLTKRRQTFTLLQGEAKTQQLLEQLLASSSKPHHILLERVQTH